MKKQMKKWRWLSWFMIQVLLLPPGAIAAPSGPASDSENRALVGGRNLYGALLEVTTKKYAVIADKIPADLINAVATKRKMDLNEVVEAKVKGLKDGSVGVSDFRKEMLQLNRKEFEEQKKEAYYQLKNLSTETLNQLSETLKNDPNYKDAQLEYQAAYTHDEKVQVLARAVNTDIDHLESMMNKRSSTMKAEHWVKDLREMQAIYTTKSDKVTAVLLLAVAGIAIVGLMSWGFANSAGHSKLKDKTNQLNAKLNDLRNQLEAQFNEFGARLNQEEMNYLQSNGYALTTCATYQLPESILCNRYGYQLFSGTKQCTVTCYKNAVTGRETLHNAPTCSSAYIPADCYDPSEYTRGYNDGYNTGYNDGYSRGDTDGYSEGRSDGYDDGYYYGKDDGYDDGYSVGFSDGYRSYWGGSYAPAFFGFLGSTNRNERFNDGYQAGLSDAKVLFDTK